MAILTNTIQNKVLSIKNFIDTESETVKKQDNAACLRFFMVVLQNLKDLGLTWLSDIVVKNNVILTITQKVGSVY